MNDVKSKIRDTIRELGQLWKLSKNRLNISEDILNSWNNLITNWVEDKNMPLIIRKDSCRGEEIAHPSGRKIIFSDNTFAVWVYNEALNGNTYELSKLRGKLANNEIPMVFALRKGTKAKYTKTLGKSLLSSTNVKWKLCHIKPVGLNSSKKIEDFDINEIIKHFKRYVNPINMFVLPKEIGGLGQFQEFIDEQKPPNIDENVL